MRYLINFIIIFSSLLFLTSCEKDAEVKPKEYPYVITNAPTVNSNGVEFSADLKDIGNQIIVEYGFVWNTKSNPTIQNFKKTFDDYKPNKGIYTYSIDYGFVKGETYYVRAYVLTDQNIIYGNERSFISKGSLPPTIDDFEPKFGPAGTKVTIIGDNFILLKDSNKVKFGDIEVIINSVSKYKMIVEIPPIVKPEKVKITIETAGMKTTSEDSFDLWFPWKQKNDISLGSVNPTCFTIGDTGYFINSNSTTMAAYNPIEDSWQTDLELPQNSGKLPLAINIDDKAYVLFDNNLWVYNKSENTWKQKKTFPDRREYDRNYTYIIQHIGNSFGVGTLSTYDDLVVNPNLFWLYNIDTDEWVQDDSFLNSNSKLRGPLFTCKLENNPYLVIGSGFWYYDQYYGFWSSCFWFPKGVSLSPWGGHVIIDNEIYVKLGYNDREIWKLEVGKWIKYQDCPVSFAIQASFSINNKGYFLTSSNDYSGKTDSVWEFDPSKN